MQMEETADELSKKSLKKYVEKLPKVTFCVEFECCFQPCMGSLWILPTVQRHATVYPAFWPMTSRIHSRP